MKIETISIGNELIYGRIVDTNAAYIAKQFSAEGLTVCRHTIVGDVHADINDALRLAVGRSDIVVMTGGLGPTKDDITRHAIAVFTEQELVFDEKSWDDIKLKFSEKNIILSGSNKVQAMRPAGSEIIGNSTGTAPGICLTFKGTKIMSLPGVPFEMRLMFEGWVLPYIRNIIKNKEYGKSLACCQSNRFMLIKEVNTFGISESLLGEKIAHLMGHDKNPVVGTQASINGIKVRLCANANSKAEAVKMLDDTACKVKQALGVAVYGEDDNRLEDAVFDLLKRHSLTIALAESCTGGLIASLLTNVSGISEFFAEGVVAYSNETKVRVLGVPEELLERHGAVSAQVASSMASGVRKHAGSDIGVGITGIAGPTGATKDKPIGLVYIAVDIKGAVDVKKHIFAGSRVDIKNRAAHTAINMLRIRLAEPVNI
ncbi:MAG: competence/damage-inducible protein A [Candidatus Anammoxibacter sp.]